METPFGNDPFAIVYYDVFKKLYPDARVDEIYWEPYIRDEEDGRKPYGLTDFGEDGTVTIFVDPELSVLNAIEIFAHELAHAAVGVEHDHDKEWQTAFDNINDKYMKFVTDANAEQEEVT